MWAYVYVRVVDLSTLLVRPANLFRDNTMTSQIISAYCKNIGSDYLKEVLKGLIKCTSIHSADTLEVPTAQHTTPPHPPTLILFKYIDRSSANQLCNNNTRAERGKTRYRCRNVSLSHHSPILIPLSCVSLFFSICFVVACSMTRNFWGGGRERERERERDREERGVNSKGQDH